MRRNVQARCVYGNGFGVVSVDNTANVIPRVGLQGRKWQFVGEIICHLRGIQTNESRVECGLENVETFNAEIQRSLAVTLHPKRHFV